MSQSAAMWAVTAVEKFSVATVISLRGAT